jgi:pyruvate,water dikinase
MPDNFIVFEENTKQSAANNIVNLIGGKAIGLQILLANNFKVPQFFVISTNIFNNLKLAKKTSAEILELKLSRDFEQKLLNNFKKLNSKLVSVRSSATLEDHKNKSFAGQFATFLNISEENLIEFVKKVWISLIKNYPNKNQSMAVIIQSMVINPEFSGVFFTQNPVTKNPEHAICEIITGYGEALVSGEKTPSHFEINNKNHQIINKFLNSDEKQLDSQKIHEISEQAQKIEKLWRTPVDIEFSIKNNQIYFLQTRPITTL